MTDKVKRYHRALEQGHSAAWDNDWEQAANYYRMAIEEKPGDTKAITSLALACFELGDFEQSLRYYLEVAKATPKDPVPMEKASQLYEVLKHYPYASEAAVRAAELYLDEKQLDRAIENWNRALSFNPENLRAHSRLAVVYERIGEKDKALREYLDIASIMQQDANLEKAIQYVNRALTISPNDEDSHKALRSLRENKPLPKPFRPMTQTSPLPLAKGDEIKQLEAPVIDAGVDTDLTPIEEAHNEALSVLAGIFFEQSREQAEERSKRGLQSIVEGAGVVSLRQNDPGRIMLHLSQVIEMQTHGNIDQAGVELKRAIDAGLDHAAAHFNLGWIRAGEERYESAYRHLSKSVQHKDFCLASHLLLGKSAQALDRNRDAAVHYLEAMRVAEGMVVAEEVASGLMQLYEPIIESQNFEEDDQKLKQIGDNIRETLVRPDWRAHLRTMREQTDASGISENPVPIADLLTKGTSNKIVEAMGRVQTLRRIGQLQAAMEEALFALEESPTYLPLHILIGDLLANSGNENGAVDKFMMIANSYQIRGETLRAVGMLKKVIDMAPLDLDSRKELVDLLVAQGAIDRAIEEMMQLAEIQYELAALDKAKEEYRNALTLAQRMNADPVWHVRILHRLADIDVQSLDWRHAIKLYSQIRDANPGDLAAVQNLVDLNFRLGQIKVAMEELNRFVGDMKKSGDKEKVFELLENLVIERPEQPVLHEFIGDAYQDNDQREDAITHLDRAGELYLEFNDTAHADLVIRKIIKLEPNNVADYEELLRQLHD